MAKIKQKARLSANPLPIFLPRDMVGHLPSSREIDPFQTPLPGAGG